MRKMTQRRGRRVLPSFRAPGWTGRPGAAYPVHVLMDGMRRFGRLTPKVDSGLFHDGQLRDKTSKDGWAGAVLSGGRPAGPHAA